MQEETIPILNFVMRVSCPQCGGDAKVYETKDHDIYWKCSDCDAEDWGEPE